MGEIETETASAPMVIRLKGTPYEQQWSLPAGTYTLEAGRIGLTFRRQQGTVTIARKLLRRYGLRQSSLEHYFFVEVGTKGPFGEGEIRVFHESVGMVDEYVKRNIRSKGVSENNNAVNSHAKPTPFCYHSSFKSSPTPKPAPTAKSHTLPRFSITPTSPTAQQPKKTHRRKLPKFFSRSSKAKSSNPSNDSDRHQASHNYEDCEDNNNLYCSLDDDEDENKSERSANYSNDEVYVACQEPDYEEEEVEGEERDKKWFECSQASTEYFYSELVDVSAAAAAEAGDSNKVLVNDEDLYSVPLAKMKLSKNS